jgi:hypothetical protein
MKVWRFELQSVTRQVVDIPLPADIIHVGTVDGKINVWAIVQPQEDGYQRPVELELYRTGEPFQELDDSEYRVHVATVKTRMMGTGPVHVFQVLERPEGYQDE